MFMQCCFTWNSITLLHYYIVHFTAVLVKRSDDTSKRSVDATSELMTAVADDTLPPLVTVVTGNLP